jgi:argininosuccinate synthase
MATRWADMLYEGRWWTPEREAMQAMSDVMSKNVTGSVRLKLYKGSATVASRQSPVSLYREDLASFGAAATYDQADAAGFIRLFGLPIRAAGLVGGDADASVSQLIREVVEAGAP